MSKLINLFATARFARRRMTFLPAVFVLVVAACGSPATPATPTAGATTPQATTGAVAAVPSASADVPGAPVVALPDASPTTPPTPGPTVPRVPTLEAPAYASRVVVPGMDIDLPVISGDVQPPPSYPFCDVAAYVTRFSQPYEPGVTYISAHAQNGMFLPLLQAERADNAQSLIGREIDVYTSDGQMFTYKVDQVVLHATDYAILESIPLDQHELILQTSEGPYGTLEKLQVVASLKSQTTVPVADANPEPHPRDCEPTAPPDASGGATPAAS